MTGRAGNLASPDSQGRLWMVMSTDFLPEDDQRVDLSRGRRSRAAPDWSSRGMRFRLLLMVGALMLVFVLMERVRDPELWRQLGFGERPAPGKKGDDGWIEVRLEPDPSAPGLVQPEPEAGTPDGMGVRPVGPPDRPPEPGVESGNPDPGSGNSSSGGTPPGAGERDIRADRALFWETVLRSLGPEHLNVLAQRMVGSASDGLEGTVRHFDQSLRGEVTRQLAGLAGESGRDPESAAEISAELVRAQSVWSEWLQPWLLSSAAQPDGAAAEDFEELQKALWRTVWSAVSDRTGPARSQEGAAWLLGWQRVLRGMDRGGSFPGLYRLMGMPEEWRGRTVRVEGTLLGVQPLDVQPNALGISRYWLLWIAVPGGGSVPLCVYAADLPEGFPRDAERYVACRKPVGFPAMFFKLRTYRDTEGKTAVCPLLLAGQPQPAAVSGGAGVSGKASAAGRWVWMGWLAILAVIAAGVSWMAARSMRSAIRSPGQTEIRQSLKELELDSAILSDREQIARFQERLQ